MGPLPDLRLTVPLDSCYLTIAPGETRARLSLRCRHCPTLTEFSQVRPVGSDPYTKPYPPIPVLSPIDHHVWTHVVPRSTFLSERHGISNRARDRARKPWNNPWTSATPESESRCSVPVTSNLRWPKPVHARVRVGGSPAYRVPWHGPKTGPKQSILRGPVRQATTRQVSIRNAHGCRVPTIPRRQCPISQAICFRRLSIAHRPPNGVRQHATLRTRLARGLEPRRRPLVVITVKHVRTRRRS